MRHSIAQKEKMPFAGARLHYTLHFNWLSWIQITLIRALRAEAPDEHMYADGHGSNEYKSRTCTLGIARDIQSTPPSRSKSNCLDLLPHTVVRSICGSSWFVQGLRKLEKPS